MFLPFNVLNSGQFLVARLLLGPHLSLNIAIAMSQRKPPGIFNARRCVFSSKAIEICNLENKQVALIVALIDLNTVLTSLALNSGSSAAFPITSSTSAKLFRANVHLNLSTPQLLL